MAKYCCQCFSSHSNVLLLCDQFFGLLCLVEKIHYFNANSAICCRSLSQLDWILLSLANELDKMFRISTGLGFWTSSIAFFLDSIYCFLQTNVQKRKPGEDFQIVTGIKFYSKTKTSSKWKTQDSIIQNPSTADDFVRLVRLEIFEKDKSRSLPLNLIVQLMPALACLLLNIEKHPDRNSTILLENSRGLTAENCNNSSRTCCGFD